MNYSILFGNLILIILILLVIIYLLKDKIKESFFNNSNNCLPEDSEVTLDEEGRPVPPPYSPPVVYNPHNQHLCKNIGWTNSGTPYKVSSNQSWYDAEVYCKKDPQCTSFSFNGDADTTSSDINYYSSLNPVESIPSMWGTEKPNLYVKTEQPCVVSTPVTVNNQLSSGNLQSTQISNMPFKYQNKFITATRDYLNDYNDIQVSSDS